MGRQKRLHAKRQRRGWRVRSRVRGTAERPRITVHRTNKHVYAQVIDDVAGRTLCAASSVSLEMAVGSTVDVARKVGQALGQRAVELQIRKVGFDRGPYRYHGRVKAVADGVRAAGVEF